MSELEGQRLDFRTSSSTLARNLCAFAWNGKARRQLFPQRGIEVQCGEFVRKRHGWILLETPPSFGSDKRLVSISKIRDYLSDGRRVATNLDLELGSTKASATRLPEKPRVEDMRALGDGYESDDPKDNNESRYGLIVLDECGTWLNSREWNDKGRRELINWYLHARKHRWDIIFLIQDIESADSQIVRALCEHLVICRRLDRMRFMRASLPRVHIANVYYGRNKENIVERWMYKGKDLYSAYDTRQVFRDGIELFDSGAIDMHGSHLEND